MRFAHPRRRRLLLAGAAIAIAIAAGVALTSRDGSHVKAVVRQPTKPAGWATRRSGRLEVAVPRGWQLTRVLSGATLGRWNPAGTTDGLPTCSAEKPLPGSLAYWQSSLHPAAALNRYLTSIEHPSQEGLGVRTVTAAHIQRVRVRGAVAAFSFTTRFSVDFDPPTNLDTADLIVGTRDGAEFHVFCAAPKGELPPNAAAAVASTTVQVPAP